MQPPDLARTVISQYGTSPIIKQLVENLNTYLDPAQTIDDFITLVLSLDTAVGYGLDLLGRVLGIGRVLTIQASKYFGFDEATTVSADPFNQSPFYGGQTLNSNYILTDDGFRVLLNAKALANISDGSIKSINAILRTLFAGRGNAFVTDGLDMTMTYTFGFAPTPVEAAIVNSSGVLPKPVGVSSSVVIA